jgi:Protein of unknown function (DUF1350)
MCSSLSHPSSQTNTMMLCSYSPVPLLSRSTFPTSHSTKTRIPLSPSSIRITTQPLPIHIPRVVPSLPDLSDGFIGSLRPSPSPKPYIRRDTCLVVPPPRGRKPLAVVMFLGGAFVGAVPEVTYRFVSLISIDLFHESTRLS